MLNKLYRFFNKIFISVLHLFKIDTKTDVLEEEEKDIVYYAESVFYCVERFIKNIVCSIKYFFQKIFRSAHISDIENWNLHCTLAKQILPKLRYFRNSKLHGYPSVFSDPEDENIPESVRADMIGGGHEAWLKVLDEIIFAFEYVDLYHRGSEKYLNIFLKKYNYEDPHAEKPENLKVSYKYRNGDNVTFTSDKPVDKDYKTVNHYYNEKLELEIANRHKNGIELFAKYFMYLWD